MDKILATKIILKRGFKANAERLAKEYREKLNIHPCAALCAFKLAEYLQIPVYKITEFTTNQLHIELLSGKNGDEWSALTMITEVGTTIIIHNPFNSEARQQSDIMHELSHIICEHKHEKIVHDRPIPFGMRNDYNQIYEEEAKCLGSTLQLASPCLLWALKKGMNHEEIANYFNASLDMVKFRINTTGIAKRVNNTSK